MKSNYLIKQVVKSDIFKIVIFIIAIVCFSSTFLYTNELVVGVNPTNYLNRVCYILGTKMIGVYTMPLIILLTAIGIIKKLDMYEYYFIRFNKKKDFHKYNIKIIISIYSIIYFIMIFLILFLHLIFRTNTFSIASFNIAENYCVTNILYLVYLIIKLYILSILSIFFNYLLFKTIGYKLTFIINVIFIGVFKYIYGMFNFYLIYHFMVSSYFVAFEAEIVSFILNLAISLLSIVFFYEIFGKKMKVIN